MDDPLRNAFMIAMGDFFAQVKVLKQRGTKIPGFKAVLLIVDP